METGKTRKQQPQFSAAKSDGQMLLETLIAYFEHYLVFPSPHYSIVLALYALNTYIYQACDATPYLAITAETKRAGKTTLLELLAMVCKNAEKVSMATVAATYGLMDMYGGWCSLFWDEAEKVAGAQLGLMRQFQNMGARKGECVPRRQGKITIKYPCWCPKVFALIGDPNDTLRDRSILVVMKRAVAPRPYRQTLAKPQADTVTAAIGRYLHSGALSKSYKVVAPDWCENREQELWEPLWSLILALGCDDATVKRFRAASVSMINRKSEPIKKYIVGSEAEAEADAESFGEKALRDLVRVMKAQDATRMYSCVAVPALRELSEAPWAEYRGLGLNEDMLASLLRVFGVEAKSVRAPKGKGGDGRKVAQGYKLETLIAAMPKVTIQQVGPSVISE